MKTKFLTFFALCAFSVLTVVVNATNVSVTVYTTNADTANHAGTFMADAVIPAGETGNGFITVASVSDTSNALIWSNTVSVTAGSTDTVLHMTLTWNGFQYDSLYRVKAFVSTTPGNFYAYSNVVLFSLNAPVVIADIIRPVGSVFYLTSSFSGDSAHTYSDATDNSGLPQFSRFRVNGAIWGTQNASDHTFSFYNLPVGLDTLTFESIDSSNNVSFPMMIIVNVVPPVGDIIRPVGSVFYLTSSFSGDSAHTYSDATDNSGLPQFSRFRVNGAIWGTQNASDHTFSFYNLPVGLDTLTFESIDSSNNVSFPMMIIVNVVPPVGDIIRPVGSVFYLTSSFSGDSAHTYSDATDNSGLPQFSRFRVNGAIWGTQNASDHTFSFYNLPVGLDTLTFESIDSSNNVSFPMMIIVNVVPPVGDIIRPVGSVFYLTSSFSGDSAHTYSDATDNSGLPQFSRFRVNGAIWGTQNASDHTFSFYNLPVGLDTLTFESIDSSNNVSFPMMIIVNVVPPVGDIIRPVGSVFYLTSSFSGDSAHTYSDATDNSGLPQFSRFRVNGAIWGTQNASDHTFSFYNLPVGLDTLTFESIDSSNNVSFPMMIIVNVVPPVGDIIRPVGSVFYLTSSFSGDSAHTYSDATDNSGLPQFSRFRVNGAIWGTQNASDHTFSFYNLPVGLDTLTFESIDSSNNVSFPMMIIVNVVPPVSVQQAIISAFASTFCYTPDGYIWVDVYGNYFANVATFTLDYFIFQNGVGWVPDGSQEIGVVQWLSSTHVRVKIWASYPYRISVTITNPGGLPSTAYTTEIIDCTTGIDEIAMDAMKAFPTLFTDAITVLVGQTAEYRIASIDGRLVTTGSLKKGQNRIDLSNVATGVYILETVLQQSSNGLRTRDDKPIRRTTRLMKQ